MKAEMGGEIQLQLFLVSTPDKCEWSTSCLCLSTTGREPKYPLNRRLGGLHNRSGRFREQKNILPLLGFYPWIYQLLTPSLYQIYYSSSPHSIVHQCKNMCFGM
jgi:hypothetical protein